MGKYIGKRILLLVPAVFLVCVIVFALMRLVPGDAVDSIIYKYSSMGISADRAGIYRSFPGSDSTSTGVTARETAAAAVRARQHLLHLVDPRVLLDPEFPGHEIEDYRREHSQRTQRQDRVK